MKLSVIPCWAYHPSEAPQGVIFREDPGELPVGWVDTPGKFDEAIAAIKAAGGKVEAPVAAPKAVATAPIPDDFDTVDAFMDAFAAASVLPEAGKQRDAALKAGLEQYLMTKYKQPIDRRQSVETIREQAVALDTEAAA